MLKGTYRKQAGEFTGCSAIVERCKASDGHYTVIVRTQILVGGIHYLARLTVTNPPLDQHVYVVMFVGLDVLRCHAQFAPRTCGFRYRTILCVIIIYCFVASV